MSKILGTTDDRRRTTELIKYETTDHRPRTTELLTSNIKLYFRLQTLKLSNFQTSKPQTSNFQTMNTLQIKELNKTYANGVRSINNISLELTNGMFGLL